MEISETGLWGVGIICVIVAMYGLATSNPKEGTEEFWLGRLSKKIFSALHII